MLMMLAGTGQEHGANANDAGLHWKRDRADADDC